MSKASFDDGYLWGDNSRRLGAPHDVTVGVAHETVLVSSITFGYWMKNIDIREVKLKCDLIIVIKTDLSVFLVTMHTMDSDTSKQYIQWLGLRPRDWNFLFACALV